MFVSSLNKMSKARLGFVIFLLVSLPDPCNEFKIFKPVEMVLKEETVAPPTLHGVAEEPGKLKDEIIPSKYRVIQGKLPFMNFLFEYDVEPDTLPMEFNITRPNLEDESFSSMVHSCLLTPNGIEYEGRMYYTSSKNICINWNNPLLYEQMKIKPFTSKDFPDKSITIASSYCRNPDNSPTPWCFRKDNHERENCSIPYCGRTNCIMTGPGMEYKGTLNMSIYGICSQWSFDVPFENISSAKASLVKNYCRNPTFDLAGPYCYVHQPYHDGGRYPWLMKSYCDIPLCDIYFNAPSYKGELYYHKRGPYIFCAVGKNIDYYTHYTLFNSERNSINISLKLWNPATVFEDEIRIVLSVLAIPANGSEFLRWDMGFELVLSNNRTGVIVNPPENRKTLKAYRMIVELNTIPNPDNFIYPPSQDSILIPVPGLLSGMRWTHLTLQWDDGGLNVNITHDEESTVLYKFREPNLADTIRGLYMNRLQYVSVLGSETLMRITLPDGGCEEQITTEEVYARFYPFFRDGPVRILQFALKSTLTSFLLMRVAPINCSLAEVLISLNGRSHSRVIQRTYKNFTMAGQESVEEILQEEKTVGDIGLYTWTFFSLSLRGSVLRLSMHSPQGVRYLFDLKNQHFASLRYYSIASVSTAHWTLGCSPDDLTSVPFLPFGNERLECSTTINDVDYRGQISVTEKGRACLPWISDFVMPLEKMFVDNNTYEAVNYCRNVLEENSAYCYVYVRLSNRTVKRESCLIPKCLFPLCRTYGTGVGNLLNITNTISGRECKYWTDADEEYKAMFYVDENTTEFKRLLLDINLSENFCRNPNNDISGPWCFTLDPNVKGEPCDVPDCDRPFETIILLTTNAKHETYVKPMWRITGWKFWVKRWERNIDAGLKLTLLPANRMEYFQIIFDGKNVSKIILVYVKGEEEPIEVERYAPYDFFLFIPNNWTGYHLTLRPERLILSTVGESSLPFLNWEYSTLFRSFLGRDPSHQFIAKFIVFEKTDAGVMAMSFEPSDPFLEILTFEEQGTYYPINYGINERLYLPTKVLSLNFRGTGNVLISFYSAIWMGPDMMIEVGAGELQDRMISKMIVWGDEVPLEVNRTEGPTIHNTNWTEFIISMTEETVTIYYNGDEFSSWKNPKPLLAYYFRLQTYGNITWTANSFPPEIDIEPINGGWSDWEGWDCSVSCGGGKGQRERFCSSPPPSLFGMPCEGDPIEFGICNSFDCGDLPPDVVEAINFRLKRHVHTMTVYQAKDSIHIGCYSDILELIYERSPNSMVYWDRNGKAITNKTTIKDAITDRYSWFKIQAQLNDSGVYSCSVHTLNVKFRPIQVTSVMVKTESAYTFVGFKGELFTFRSNNEVLAFLYDNLELTWLHNGIPSEKYTEIYLPLVNTKEIALDMDDTGEWECTIRHKIFNMKWHTNWVKIKVKYRNEFVKYLMDDNQYTKHVFKDFEPLYVEISFAILVILVAILSFGAAGLLSYCQRILRRQWKDLFRVIHDKLRGESSYQGHIPHTSSESNSQQVSDFSISSSMSSGDKRYIQKEEEPTIYYLTDEDVTVTDSTDNLGLKRTVKRRKILRDVAHSKKHPRSYGAKREESHKNSNVRRERVLTLRREQKARREQMSESSSDSYNSIYTYEPDPYNNYHLTLDLLNYHQRAKKALGIISPEASTHDIQGGKNKKRDLHMNSDETSLQLLEKQLAKNEKVNKEEENPYINFAGKSQFHTDRHVHKKRGVYWRKLADYNTDDSEYSFDSDSYYSVDMDSLVLASTDSEISDAEIF